MILRTFCPFFVFLFVKYLCLPERRLVIGYIYKKEDCDCRYGECPTELRSSARQAHFAEKPVDFHSLQFFRQGLDVHANRFQSDESGHFLTNRFRWSFGCTTHADRHFYLVQKRYYATTEFVQTPSAQILHQDKSSRILGTVIIAFPLRKK